jgi:Rieske Fe-S protein
VTEAPERPSTVTRREALIGAGALGAAAVFTACGGKEPSSAPTSQSGDNKTTSAAPKVVHTSDVPVGGGTVLEEQGTVITQPRPGQLKAFSATCTHMGCTVSDVSDGKINCPCHGSQYNITDGSVANGPATRPLPEKTVTVNSDNTLTIR